MKIDNTPVQPGRANLRADAPPHERKANRPQAASGARFDPAALITLSRQAAMASPLAAQALSGKGETALSSVMQQEQQKTKELTSKLDEARQQMAEQKKSAARDRLEAVKKKLEMARLLGGDPKVLARQAKEMAKELASAAKDYASAAKELGGSAAMPAADPAGAETTNGAAAPAEQAGETDSKKAAQAYQAMADHSTAAFNKDRSEADVVSEFKRTADGVKSLMSDAARRLKSDKAGTKLADELRKHSDELDRQIKNLAISTETADDNQATLRPAMAVNIMA